MIIVFKNNNEYTCVTHDENYFNITRDSSYPDKNDIKSPNLVTIDNIYNNTKLYDYIDNYYSEKYYDGGGYKNLHQKFSMYICTESIDNNGLLDILLFDYCELNSIEHDNNKYDIKIESYASYPFLNIDVHKDEESTYLQGEVLYELQKYKRLENIKYFLDI